MKSSELETIKASLLAKKSAILNKTNEFRAESAVPQGIADEAELAAQDLSLNISLNLHERDRVILFQIERALSRIGSGAYQSCESCGCAISAKRLKASPFATLCIDCQEDREGGSVRN